MPVFNPLELPEEHLSLYKRPVCLVTGGSSGIGLATACRFASQGYNLVVCARDQTRLQAAKGQILDAADGSSLCLTTACNLAEVSAPKQLHQFCVENLGRIDVLVNNAANAPLGAFDEISEDVLDQTIAINIRSVFRLSQFVWRTMKEQDGGTIVNISSLAAVDPFPGFSLYGSSKAWIDLLTVALASEGAEFGIRVCSVRPGAVETSMLRGLFPDFPAEQCVSPEDVADRVWRCVDQPADHPSGDHFAVTNQT